MVAMKVHSLVERVEQMAGKLVELLELQTVDL